MGLDPLTREEVRSVIEGRARRVRVPLLLHFWLKREEFADRLQSVEEILGRYPMDAQVTTFNMPDASQAPADEPGYCWVKLERPRDEVETRAWDSRIALPHWSGLDNLLDSLPDPHSSHLFPSVPSPDGRYQLGWWWTCLFERHWSLRGMQNAMLDFYFAPDAVLRLYRAFTDFYVAVIERGKEELDLDGIFVTDDIGSQQGPMFSPQVFQQFFRPFYKELIDKAHSLGMHFWLHSCGNITKFVPDLVRLGVDVLHPIQKHTMDEAAIARHHGKDVCIWAGFDVQRAIPFGTPDDIRREVRYLMDNYRRPEGRLVFGAGNFVPPDCTLASLEALYDEALRYSGGLSSG